MPALGMAQETGKLISWLAKEGDEVENGQPLMEIETDKATVEIEAAGSGILSNLTALVGDDVPVGQVIAFILAPGEAAPETPLAAPVTHKNSISSPNVPASPSPTTARVETPAQGNAFSVNAAMVVSPLAMRMAEEHGIDLALVNATGNRIEKIDVTTYMNAQNGLKSTALMVAASPKARRLARERTIELASIYGSGPDGSVLADDVIGYENKMQAEPDSLSKAWRVMAERMTTSWTTVPHFFLLRQVNADRFISWRAEESERSGIKLTYTDLLVKIVAAALLIHPQVNSAWINNTIKPNDEINIGLAVATDDALLVPVIHNADELNLEQIAANRKAIVENAQVGKLKLNEILGGTFTISNLGMYNVDTFNAIVNPPQAAILAVGRIADQVVPVNGRPEVQPMMTLSLSSDHRVVDGARAAKFLDTVASMIEQPPK